MKQAVRYKVDLAAQHAECEANYWRLMKLMPSVEVRDEHRFSLVRGGSPVDICLRVTEAARYTATVEVSQPDRDGWLSLLPLTIRLYHDARMAEVIDQRRRVHPGRYDYPNVHMFQPDEKAQLNRFLGEWLNHCLNHGYSTEEVAISPAG